MKTKETFERGQAFNRPTNVLLAIAAKARDIRKLLGNPEKRVVREAWGTLRDARRLADAVEALASHAVGLPVEDATVAVEMLEAMIDQLETMADQVLTR